jgi:hypothetical protein
MRKRSSGWVKYNVQLFLNATLPLNPLDSIAKKDDGSATLVCDPAAVCRQRWLGLGSPSERQRNASANAARTIDPRVTLGLQEHMHFLHAHFCLVLTGHIRKILGCTVQSQCSAKCIWR